MEIKIILFGLIIIIIFLELLLLKPIKKNKKIILLNVIIIISTSFLVFNNNLNNNQKQNEIEFYERVKEKLINDMPERIYVPTKSAISSNQSFTKTEALNTLKYIFDLTIGDKKTIKTRLDNIIKDRTTLFNNIDIKVLNKLHLTNEINTDLMQSNTVIALLGIVNTFNSDKAEIRLTDMNAIYMDKDTNSCYIPLDIFTGHYTATSIQMVYVNNEWKLNPYSLMLSIQLSDLISSKYQATK